MLLLFIFITLTVSAEEFDAKLKQLEKERDQIEPGNLVTNPSLNVHKICFRQRMIFNTTMSVSKVIGSAIKHVVLISEM
jgi:hypothetical protein